MKEVINLRKRVLNYGGGYVVESLTNRREPDVGEVLTDGDVDALLTDAKYRPSNNPLTVNIKKASK